jgi:peptidoglycan hydrolase-like protein with peptidoglycan-binding domain
MFGADGGGMTVARAFLGILMLLLAGLAPAEARRVALVIGIDAYQQVQPLSRARNDATAVAAQLTTAGFDVILRTDPDRRALSVALSEFEDRLRGAEVGMFFFAGHGVEIRGTNVLLPADIPSTLSEAIILREGLLLTDLAQTMADAGVRYSALIIDACRDNPLPRQAGRSVGRTRGLGRADAPRGTYVVYSAGIGEAALDRLSDTDASPNSVFTRHLLPALAEPGLSLDAAVKQVRDRVRSDAALVRHAQNPAIYDQATGELYLIPQAPRPEPPPPASVALPPPVGGADATEMLFWQSIQVQGQPAELEAYLARWPTGIFAPIARARLAALAAPPPPPRSLPAVPPAPLGRDGVIAVQRELARLGLDPGPADGAAGPRTAAAVRAFQSATGLPVDGEATEPVLQRLRDGSAPGQAVLAQGLAAQVPALIEARSLPEAARVMEVATRLAPRDGPLAPFWLLLGDAQRERGAMDAARRAYGQAQQAGVGTPAAEEAQRRLASLPAVTPASAGAQAGAAAIAPAPPGRCGVSFAGVRSQDGLTGFAFRNSCATAMAFRAECPGAPSLARGDLTVGANAATTVWAPARGAVQACRVVSNRAR